MRRSRWTLSGPRVATALAFAPLGLCVAPALALAAPADRYVAVGGTDTGNDCLVAADRRDDRARGRRGIRGRHDQPGPGGVRRVGLRRHDADDRGTGDATGRPLDRCRREPRRPRGHPGSGAQADHVRAGDGSARRHRRLRIRPRRRRQRPAQHVRAQRDRDPARRAGPGGGGAEQLAGRHRLRRLRRHVPAAARGQHDRGRAARRLPADRRRRGHDPGQQRRRPRRRDPPGQRRRRRQPGGDHGQRPRRPRRRAGLFAEDGLDLGPLAAGDCTAIASSTPRAPACSSAAATSRSTPGRTGGARNAGPFSGDCATASGPSTLFADAVDDHDAGGRARPPRAGTPRARSRRRSTRTTMACRSRPGHRRVRRGRVLDHAGRHWTTRLPARSGLAQVQPQAGLRRGPRPSRPCWTLEPRRPTSRSWAGGDARPGRTASTSDRSGSAFSPLQKFRVTNTGNQTLSIAEIGIRGDDAGDFSLPPADDGCFGQSLRPGASCSAKIRFAPGGGTGRFAQRRARRDVRRGGQPGHGARPAPRSVVS